MGRRSRTSVKHSVKLSAAARAGPSSREFVDEGISGAKGRDKRPQFDRMLKAVTRGKIDVVAAWSVDRLGRSLQDLVGFSGS
jgi:DNA invertase Pin-like site-specific DNA recombinase